MLGTLVSFHIDGATGACIVLIQAAVFVLAFLFAPKRGLIAGAGSSGAGRSGRVARVLGVEQRLQLAEMRLARSRR